MAVILIILLILFFLMKRKRVQPGLTDSFVRTKMSPTDLWSVLRRSGLSPKGSLLALAHATSESLQSDGFLRSCAHNYWNFGEPSWWNEFDISEKTGRCPRKDEVGFTVSFPCILDAIQGYIELLRRNKPEAFNQLFSENPNVDTFVNWLCAETSGFGTYDYAGACKFENGYRENLKSWYQRYLTNLL